MVIEASRGIGYGQITVWSDLGWSGG